MRQPSGKTQHILLLAHPADHVKAPIFMNPAFESLGLDWFLTAMDVRPENLEAAVRGLQKLENLLGLNLTIPHKETMAKLCDELGPHAKLTGAVNAVRFEGGRLVGEIFDGVGLLIGQKENGIEVRGRSVLILGAGGAGRAVAFAYAQEGARKLRITNRNRDRAARLVGDIKAVLPDLDVDVASSDPTGYDIVCNCTSLGLHEGDPMPTETDKLQASCDVVDIIAVRDTELMATARAKGCRVMGGEPMAVGQLKAFAEFFAPGAPRRQG